jgi:hypothetical protein
MGTLSAGAGGKKRTRSFFDVCFGGQGISGDLAPVRPTDALAAMQAARNRLKLRRRSQTVPGRVVRELVQS